MPDRPKAHDPMLDLPDDDDVSPEHIGEQVQKAHDQLAQLRRQQELIEKQKIQLEELGKRQETFQRGRAEMVEHLTRALVVVERETYDAQKRVEQLQGIQESYTAHLALLESINPRAWEGLDINKELSKALSAVDDARAEYSKTRPKISPEPGEEHVEHAAGDAYGYAYAPEKDFVYWLKAGFGFTLPLLVLGVIILIVILAQVTPA